MLKKIGTVMINSQPRELFEDIKSGEKYVQSEGGEFITLRGAKTFKTDVSQGYPLPPEIQDLAKAMVHGAVSPFPLLSEEDQEGRLKEFFDAAFTKLQERDKALHNREKGSPKNAE